MDYPRKRATRRMLTVVGVAGLGVLLSACDQPPPPAGSEWREEQMQPTRQPSLEQTQPEQPAQAPASPQRPGPGPVRSPAQQEP